MARRSTVRRAERVASAHGGVRHAPEAASPLLSISVIFGPAAVSRFAGSILPDVLRRYCQFCVVILPGLGHT
jgi:hypothetical protein